MEQDGKGIGPVIFVFVFLFAIVAIFVASKTMESDKDEKAIKGSGNVTRNIVNQDSLIGSYTVEQDKGTILILKEDNNYRIYINTCEGYLELNGKYEVNDNKLKLINDKSFEIYPSLNNNKELMFTIEDENNLKLEEDLICVYQNTLFTK